MGRAAYPDVSLRPARTYMGSMNKIFLLVALAAAAVPSAATARSTTVAPPGNSAVNQYLENVPTASGSRPANTIHVGGGGVSGGSGGSGGSSGSGGGGSSAVSAGTQQALSRQGGDGLAAAALARATAPAGIHSASQTSSAAGSNPAPGSGPSAVGTLVNALTGGSSEGGLGPILPVILVVSAIGAVLAAIRGRRQHDQ
jgi:hypothetical protein